MLFLKNSFESFQSVMYSAFSPPPPNLPPFDLTQKTQVLCCKPLSVYCGALSPWKGLTWASHDKKGYPFLSPFSNPVVVWGGNLFRVKKELSSSCIRPHVHIGLKQLINEVQAISAGGLFTIPQLFRIPQYHVLILTLYLALKSETSLFK